MRFILIIPAHFGGMLCRYDQAEPFLCERYHTLTVCCGEGGAVGTGTTKTLKLSPLVFVAYTLHYCTGLRNSELN